MNNLHRLPTENRKLLYKAYADGRNGRIRVELFYSKLTLFFSQRERIFIIEDKQKKLVSQFILTEIVADWLSDKTVCSKASRYIDENIAKDEKFLINIFGARGLLFDQIMVNFIEIEYPDSVGCIFEIKEEITDSNRSAIIYSILKNYPTKMAHPKYRDRIEPKESARSFLERVYSFELNMKAITLSELYKIDEPLWRALRNWAHNGKHDLDAVIQRGENNSGRPQVRLGFDPHTLDPNDPVAAAALQLVKRREANRMAMRRRRKQTKLAK